MGKRKKSLSKDHKYYIVKVAHRIGLTPISPNEIKYDEISNAVFLQLCYILCSSPKVRFYETYKLMHIATSATEEDNLLLKQITIFREGVPEIWRDFVISWLK